MEEYSKKILSMKKRTKSKDNFENFNYLFDSLKDDKIFDIDKYKNYLFMKENIIKDKEEEKEEKDEKSDIIGIKGKKNEYKMHRHENESNINYIQNLNKLQYLKDNIFFVFDKTFIKFFKYENYSFNSLLSYDLGKIKIIMK